MTEEVRGESSQEDLSTSIIKLARGNSVSKETTVVIRGEMEAIGAQIFSLESQLSTKLKIEEPNKADRYGAQGERRTYSGTLVDADGRESRMTYDVFKATKPKEKGWADYASLKLQDPDNPGQFVNLISSSSGIRINVIPPFGEGRGICVYGTGIDAQMEKPGEDPITAGKRVLDFVGVATPNASE